MGVAGCGERRSRAEISQRERIEIAATDFLREARGVLLARYAALLCARLDALLEQAGILKWYRGDPGRTGSLPSYSAPLQPLLNRPYPTGSFPALHRRVSHDVCRNTS